MQSNHGKMFRNQQGFTITELSLAMAMLSVLMVIILLSAMNITSIYNKGITLKRVNQSGRTISTELQADLRKAAIGDGVTKVVNIGYREQVIDGQPYKTGICIGKNSYIWSLYLDGGGVVEEKFTNGQTISFIKISDPGMCIKDPSYKVPDKANSSILLDDDLVVRWPTGVQWGASSGLIRFTFTISTSDSDIGVITAGSCQGGKEGDFCALNTFVVTAYANM